ncbi:MAG: hypothetical protein KGO81_01115 [Bacteroidota bacterium]|nr:hypothetical protein [Bacteroidota bacterium]
MKTYEDAYKELEKYVLATPISEATFNELKYAFRENYLASKQFLESVASHRNPNYIKNELMRELNEYLIAIQNRNEMRDMDPNTNAYGFVPTALADMWRADRSFRSLYKTLQSYCFQRQKNFTTIAIHIAEYRSLYQLYNRLKRQINKASY